MELNSVTEYVRYQQDYCVLICLQCKYALLPKMESIQEYFSD